jgi:hypothetical protein
VTAISESAALQVSEALCAAVMLVMSAEYISASRARAMDTGTLLDWDIYALQPGWHFRGSRGKLLRRLYGVRGFICINVVRMVLSVLLLVFPPAARGAPLVGLFALSCLINVRHAHGRDGADEMAMIVLVGLLAYRVADQRDAWRWAGIAFVSAQVTLAYLVSGVAKLISSEWRSGTALPGIMATEIYGHRHAERALGHRAVAFLTAWATMLWEAGFVLYWVTPEPWAYAWLGAGVAFHVGTALGMGLNTFLLAFLAGYPLLILAHSALMISL